MVDDEIKQDALFVQLVMLFKQAALQQMGKLINPITGKVEKNLDQARFSIDTLDMLKAKTAGNLSNELERLLDTTLIELRMNYIAEVESETKEKQGEPSSQTPSQEREPMGDDEDVKSSEAKIDESTPSQAVGKDQKVKEETSGRDEQVTGSDSANSHATKKTCDKAQQSKAKQKSVRSQRKTRSRGSQ